MSKRPNDWIRPERAMDVGNAPNGSSVEAERSPRRGSYRTRAEIPALLCRESVDETHAWLRCWLRDLSTNGASIEGTLGLGLGDGVRLRFGKPQETLTLSATVVRVDTEGRVFGIRFDVLDAREADGLYAFVMELAHEYVEYRSRHLSWEPVQGPTTTFTSH
jgi:hypothetical protein